MVMVDGLKDKAERTRWIHDARFAKHTRYTSKIIVGFKINLGYPGISYLRRWLRRRLRWLLRTLVIDALMNRDAGRQVPSRLSPSLPPTPRRRA